METPIYSKLLNYNRKGNISFAMPGHKNGAGLCRELILCDVTELEDTADLYHDDECVKKANALLTKLYKTKESRIITGGSTNAVQAMICAVFENREKTLLCAGNCHMSVINTCTLLGIKIRIAPMNFNEDFCIPSRIINIEEILKAHDDIGAVIITSPDYYGQCEDVRGIADICRKFDIPLLVDEAHGAHFICGDPFPKPAELSGADLVCSSAHKTLNALTGAAYLHICSDRINRERVHDALTMFASSSPSYVTAASADCARANLEDNGDWMHIYKICENFRRRTDGMCGIRVLDNDDITRIVLNFKNCRAKNGGTVYGADIESGLAKKGINAEMSDLYNVVFIVTPWNRENELDALYNALKEVLGEIKGRECEKIKVYHEVPHEEINPSAGYFSENKTVELSEGVGYVSAVTVTVYPPGIPVIYRGGIITKAAAEYVLSMKNRGFKITGAEKDGRIKVVK